jgi:hypothetical protein
MDKKNMSNRNYRYTFLRFIEKFDLGSLLNPTLVKFDQKPVGADPKRSGGKSRPRLPAI